MGNLEKKWYADKVNKWMQDNHGISLMEFCTLMKYPERELEILSVKRDKESMMALYRKYKSLFDESQANELCKKRKGKNRTWTEYFQSVIAGWAMEDMLSLWLTKNGFEVGKSGDDRCRKLLVSSITNAPDIIIGKSGHNKRKVELVFESEDYISKYGYIEKRLRSLWDAHKAGSVFLFIDISCNKYVIIDFALENIKLHLRHHKKWDKDVHRYNLDENGKIPRQISMMIDELDAVCLSDMNGETPLFEEVEDKDSPPTEFGLGGKKHAVTEIEEKANLAKAEDSGQRKETEDKVLEEKNDKTEGEVPMILEQERRGVPMVDEEPVYDCDFV